ncbi:MAG: efflux RND transporter permease subunit [Spirochaetes bacterium]|nr:efflux RND transporter permease subunit [Spirochaetota bacterium]MBU1080368.1 efflux RND transporter permease subunit [Spirochaetota bacterium]
MLKLIFGKTTGFIVFSVLLCALGIALASRLPVMMYPQTRRPMVSVRFSHPGISAVDFQQDYADSIEPRLAALDGVDVMETTYSSDSSSITLTFDWETKSADAKALVESTMFSINGGLPSEIRDGYSIRFRESENAGFIVMGATSAGTSPEVLMERLSANVEPRLRAIRDVEVFGIYGLEELQVTVTLDQEAMLSYGLSASDVNAAFQAGLSPQPLGAIRESGERFSVRVKRADRSIAALPRLEIKRFGDTLVSLDDISDIDIRYAVPRQVFMIEDRPAIQVTLTPVEGGNLNTMTEELLAVMTDARDSGQLPADTEFNLYVDPAKYIKRSIDQVIRAALIGGFLAILIVFLILGEPRNTLIIAVSLPVSIMLSFILMYAFKVSLNLISLGGFALAVGMIVDSTIVVMENIHRWRREDTRVLNSAMWKHIVMESTRQVRGPVISSTLTSVLVFLPLSFSAPLANAILGDQARTVVFSLLCSLFVSLSLVPVIAYFLFRGKGKQNVDHLSARGFARLSEPVIRAVVGGYRRILQALISRRLVAGAFLAVVLAAMVVAVAALFPGIPKEIMSKPQSDRVVLFFRHAEYDTSVDIIEKLMPELRERLAGALSGMEYRSYANVSGRFNQLLVDFGDTAEVKEALGRLEREFVSEGLWYFNIQSWDPAALPLPQVYALRLSVYGPDSTRKAAILDEMQRLLNDSRLYGRINVRPSPAMVNELVLTPRNEALRGFPGLTSASLTALAKRALGGTVPLTVTDGTYEVQVAARYPETALDSRDKLANLLIPWRDSYVPFKHFFDFEVRSGVSQVYSENGELAFRLYASSSADMTDAERLRKERDAMALFAEKLVMPAGYSYTLDNPRAEIDDAVRSLFVAMGISIVLIYLLLCFQFNSLWIPLIIIVTIPLGFAGVVISLYAFRSTLNLNSLLGTILLGGIVVNNAIIMIDFYLNARKEYPDHLSAIVGTAALRFQPILITTLTTIFGMLPIAVGLGSGSSILQPLGIAVSGGLILSSFLTLFAIPAILSFWRYDP